MKRSFIFLLMLVLFFPVFTYAQQAVKAGISDSIDVLHYDINLDMVHLSTKRISGYTDLQITPRVTSISSFRLWLQSLSVDSVKINGVSALWVHYNDTLLTVGLPAVLSPADTVTARVYYHGLPVLDGSTWGGFYFTNDSSFAYNLGVGFESVPHNYGRVWFPCIDDFVDRATYDCRITVKSDKMAVCGGSLMSVNDNGNGTKTVHWALHQSVPTYLASVAVGPYVAVNGVYNGISANIPTSIYVRAGDTTATKNSFINLNSILSVYENHFGPYGWERVGYVGVPFSGGAMEHVTNIAYPLLAINGNLSNQSLYAHELAHMWFGDLVTCATAEDMWINEGWARYCEGIVEEGLYGKAAYATFIRDLHHSVVQFAHIEDNGYRALYGIPPEYTYGTTVYDKGGDVAHTLRGYLGDSLFFSALKNYFNDYAYNHISSTDFRDYLSAQTGVDLTSFFDAWVFAPGFPHFSIDSFHVVGTAPASVTVYVRQRLDHAPALANDNILEVTFLKTGNVEYTDTIHFSGASGVKTFTVPFVPEAVVLDKNEKISDAITSYSMGIKTTGTKDFTYTNLLLNVSSVTDSAWIRVEHNFVAPDPLKAPNPAIQRLSDYRYWKVDGLIPAGFEAAGRFRYNRSTSTSNGYLDNTLLKTNTSKDSLLLLYRAGTWDDWQIVPTTLTGTTYSGELVCGHIKKGEYCLAIVSPEYYGTPEIRDHKEGGMNIYPNPSGSDFTIEWQCRDARSLCMYDPSGILREKINLEQTTAPIRWSPADKSAGTYVFRLYNSKNELVCQEKAIYLP
jgi:aminopeptidase N